MHTSCDIRYHPIFTDEDLQNLRKLESRLVNNVSPHLATRRAESWNLLSRNVGSLWWPTLSGPGFGGGTHPGTEKLFSTIMAGSSAVSNDDCLYVNPACMVFAISDAPEMSTYSRQLLGNVDRSLAAGRMDMQSIINEAARTETQDRATLALLQVVARPGLNHPGSALAFVSGDTRLFHGNLHRVSMVEVEGQPQFLGRSRTRCNQQELVVARGDFFAIVSDGVHLSKPEGVKEAIRGCLDVRDMASSAAFTIQQCNHVEQRGSSGPMATSIGGSDNISLLFVFPEELAGGNASDGVLAGGWIRSLQSPWEVT